jgi:hypothetical protein
MTRTCEMCHRTYDDAACWTFCPHEEVLTPSLRAQKDLAISLFGHHLRWAHDTDLTGDVVHVESMNYSGMVTLRERQYAGEFAPHLFRKMGPEV